jgi:two-component system, chemotaxis family, chemotaxis protein CheY
VSEGPPQPAVSITGARLGARLRVLVVDDEELVRLVLARTLHLSGFDVFEAQDGLDALARLPAIAPDVVLTDLNMPRCSGERLCVEIKRNPATAGIHVVIMTGGPLDEAHMREIGCAAVIYKPVPDRLPDMLAAIAHGATASGDPDLWTRVGDDGPPPASNLAAR